MKTPSIDDMKLAVAKMLPDEIEIRESYYTEGVPAFFWVEDGGGPETMCGQYIRYTEWLHVCMLAEETLTEEEDAEYVNEMDWLREKAAREKGGEADYGHVGPVEFRLAALCSVKHPEMFK